MNIADLRQLVGKGELNLALQETIAYSEKRGNSEAYNNVIGMSGELEEYARQWQTGQLSFDTYARQMAVFNQRLLAILDHLQQQPDEIRKMTKESTFKKRLLWLLLIGKILVIGRLFRHWSTGGFNDEQGWACLGILAPTMAGYLFIVFDDYLRQHKLGIKTDRYVSGTLSTLAYIIIPLYIIALLILIEKKVMPPHLPFSQVIAGFALIESVLGGYVSRVIATFFKSEPS